MEMFVCKFGGTSLSVRARYERMKNIVRADERRRFIVVSAPGGPPKVTDMLVMAASLFGKDFSVSGAWEAYCADHPSEAQLAKELLGDDISFDAAIERVRRRFNAATSGGVFSIPLDELEQHASLGYDALRSYVVSRGEYYNAQFCARLLGYEFVDAAEIIIFNSDGTLDLGATRDFIQRKLQGDRRVVVPGFYGVDLGSDRIHLFSRGGSDLTGALIAHALSAQVYENWTDVPGVMTADPRIVDTARPIEQMTYRSLHELAYSGARVIHPSTMPYLSDKVTLNVRMSMEPDTPGTLIFPELDESDSVIGLAGRKGFSIICMRKRGMNDEVGVGLALLREFDVRGIPYQHTPTNLNSMAVVVHNSFLQRHWADIRRAVLRSIKPDEFVRKTGLAILSIVGGAVRRARVKAMIYTALADAGIEEDRMVDGGASQQTLLIGVNNDQLEDAMRAVHRALLEPAEADHG